MREGACGSLLFLDNNVFSSILTHFLIKITLALAVISTKFPHLGDHYLMTAMGDNLMVLENSAFSDLAA